MNELKWTPGPWPLIREGLRGGVYWCVVIPGMEEGIDLREDENGEANARLIAAAPELYEALEEAIECAMFPEDIETIIRAALTKARGDHT